MRLESGCGGRTARPRSEARTRSIGTPRSRKATASEGCRGLVRGPRSGCRLHVRTRRAGRRCPATATLPAVSLPDLSRMEKPVQQQLTEQISIAHGEDRESRVRRPTSSARRTETMGNLLLAAEYFDAAEACYLHAQSLAPDDVRWPYYLGHVYMTKAELGKAAASFERALHLRPDDVADAGLARRRAPRSGRARAGRAVVRAGAVASAWNWWRRMFGLGRAALAKRDYRVRQSIDSSRRCRRIHARRSFTIRSRWPIGDSETRRKAEEHLRQRGSVEVGPPDPLMVQLRGLLHSAVAEENEGIRALDGRRLQDGRGALSQGRRAGAGQPVAPPQARHGVIADGRYERRASRNSRQRSGCRPGSRRRTTALACCWRRAADTRRRRTVSRRRCGTSRTTSMRGFDSARCCSGSDARTPRCRSMRRSSPSIRASPRRGSGMRWRSFSSRRG